MANLLESSQNTATVAPDYYTNYLSNLANAGTQAGQQAQFVGAQPLQEKAFQNVEEAASAFKPQLAAASGTLEKAVNAYNPYEASLPFLAKAVQDPSQAASQYMTPYIRSVVDALGDTGARNIRQNLAPLATSGAVGSGQFGSKRGAEVLGQTMSNAERDILNAQSNAMNTGYQNALNAAISQNQIAGTAGATAANAAGTGQSNLTQAGNVQGNLAATNQQLNLADINALATLGAQQQTIEQNRQNYPLTQLSTLSGLMAGQTIPTTQTQKASASPLSMLASGTTGLAGLFQPMTDANGKAMLDANNNPITKYSSLMSGLSNAGSSISNWYKNTFPSPVQTYEVDPNEAVGRNAQGTEIYFDQQTGNYYDRNGKPVSMSLDEGE